MLTDDIAHENCLIVDHARLPYMTEDAGERSAATATRRASCVHEISLILRHERDESERLVVRVVLVDADGDDVVEQLIGTGDARALALLMER